MHIIHFTMVNILSIYIFRPLFVLKYTLAPLEFGKVLSAHQKGFGLAHKLMLTYSDIKVLIGCALTSCNKD